MYQLFYFKKKLLKKAVLVNLGVDFIENECIFIENIIV